MEAANVEDPAAGNSGGSSQESGGSGGVVAAGSGGSGVQGSGGTFGSGGTGAGGVTGAGGSALGGAGNGGGGVTGAGGTVLGGSGGTLEGGSGGGGSGGATGGTGGSSGGAGGGGSGGGGQGGAGSGGSGGSGSPVCNDADKTLTNNGTGQHCGYTYEYWRNEGSGTVVFDTEGFEMTWSNGSMLGRKGIRPGSGNLVATYEADYQPSGNSYLCIYGWTTSPLVEYYIVDGWGSWRPPGGSPLGTVQSDGGTYDIYKTQRVNQPSIQGQQTFWQFWSVRQSKRTSGTITIANHFAAWDALGMDMGTFYEVSMTVEGYQSSGSADVKFTLK